jgi:putative flippase GtrA
MKAQPARRSKSRPKAGPALVKQGAKFGLVGISNTVIDYALYIGVSRLLNVPVDRVFLVKFFSGTVAMINSFYWNRRWTFRSQAKVGQAGVRFVTATLVSIYAIQPGMVFLFSGTAAGVAFSTFWFQLAQTLGLAGLLHLSEDFVVRTVAFGMGVVGSAIWNFTLYKLWAFKED